MTRTRPEILFLIILLVLAVMGALLTVFNRAIVVPLGGDQVYAPIWEAARLVSQQADANPYLPGALPRSTVLLAHEPIPPRFLYPYYSLALFGPFAAISPYSLSRAVWMTLGMISLVGLAFVAVMLTRWRPGPVGTLIYVLFAFGGLHSIRAAFLGNPSPVIAVLIAAALLLVVRERYTTAGILFGLTALQPAMVVLLLPFVFIWGVSKRRKGLVWGLVGTLAVLIGGSLYLLPQWPAFHYFELLAHFRASFPSSLAAVAWTWFPAAGPRAMGVVAVLFLAILLISWWQAFGKGARWFLWTAALTLTITHLIGIPVSLSSQTVLLIPFALVFSTLTQRWHQAGPRISVVLMAGLLAGEWALFWLTMRGSLTGPPSSALLIWLPVSALVLLYWVRHWALESLRLKASHLEALRRL